MSILVSNLILCILLFTLTLGLKQEDGNMISSRIEDECQALLDIKAYTHDYGGFLDDWGNFTDCCKWSGVRCSNLTGHVIELKLSWLDFQLNPIPKVVGSLSNLQYLDFFHANISGPIPHELGNLSKLFHLDLGHNSLHGPIPRQLANLSNLLHLDLSSNPLGGFIPYQLCNLSKLLHLDLSDNHLGGSIPFFLGDLTSLSYLDLSQNQLGGVIPISFRNWSALVNLDLSLNLLSGPMPSFVGCSSLYHMSVAYNSLNGSLPDFTGCISLDTLDLSSNIFSGSMPHFIGCASLRLLNVSSNKLSGNVPSSLGQLSNLEYLNVLSNSLEGVISEVHFQNLTKLYYLDLSMNSLALNLSVHGRIPFQLSTIKLQSCRLGPSFPKWIETQSQFKYLDISNAGISDHVPVWFWDLPVNLIYLNISSNEIQGMIPNITTPFEKYPVMDLSNNRFEGRAPVLSSVIAILNLSGNRFSGTLSFLCDTEVILYILDLSNNLFSGTLPHCWLNFQSLFILNLSKNNLSGEIPFSLGLLSKLEALYMRKNAFVGEVPISLSNCTRLRFLDLRENKLSGVIPEWIGEQLSLLYVLVLGSNRFYGRLTSQVCWLHNLHVLDVSNNRLSGNIPRCFYNFTAMATRSIGNYMLTSHSLFYWFPIPNCEMTFCDTSVDAFLFSDNAWVTWKGTEQLFREGGLQLLKSIDLSRNNFHGKFPYQITILHELVSLNLSNNQLHGEVPKDIGRLAYLESLDLSRNEFSGHIPRTLADLTFLSYLNLSFNNLSGRIPTGPQLQSFDCTSYDGNPQLSGPPLTSGCGFLPPPGKKDVEEDEDNFWESYYTGMGVGFAVGFWGICGPLFFNRRFRYFFFALLSRMKDWIYVMVIVHFGKVGRKIRR